MISYDDQKDFNCQLKKKASASRLSKVDDKSNKEFSFEEPAIEAPDCGDQSIDEEEKSIINALSFNTAHNQASNNHLRTSLTKNEDTGTLLKKGVAESCKQMFQRHSTPAWIDQIKTDQPDNAQFKFVQRHLSMCG